MMPALLIPLLLVAPVDLAQPDLREVDQFLQSDRFDNAVHEGDEAVIQTESCIGSFCDSPYSTVFTVESVTPDQATLVGRKEDGSVISQQTLTRAMWESQNQNRVRFEMETLAGGGLQPHVIGITPSTFQVSIDGQTQTVRTLEVQIEGVNQIGMKTDETLEVAPGLGVMGQLLLQQMSTGNTYTVIQIKH